MTGFKVDYKKQKFDKMERGEYHKPMKTFIRNEELNEKHFISDKKSGRSMVKL